MRTFIALFLGTVSLFAGGELSGRRAPGFALPDSHFKYQDPQDYHGRILLVEFMQTNCPHCATFSTILEQIKAKYPGKVAVLSIVNPPDNQGTVSRYVAAHKITSPILFDCGQVAAAYLKVTPQSPSFSLPHVFVIDQQGIIRDDYGYDALSRDIFEGKGLYPVIDRLLAPKPPAAKKK
jgi:peroxiredoxin